MNPDELKDILLAEDSANDIELTVTALEKHKIANRLVVVRDGAEVMDYLLREGGFADRAEGNPAVILLDLKMPRVDGLEVLRRVKSDPKLKSIPIVVLTSSREESDLAEGYRLGVNAYVVKPVRFNEFIGAVEQLGVFWALVNEPPPGSLTARNDRLALARERA